MTDIQRDHKRLHENLKMLQTVFTAATLAKALGISKNTWTNRMKEPWKAFSYDDFKLLAKYCKVDFVKLMDGELKIG